MKRVVSLCNSADEPPTAHLLRPPSELLAHADHSASERGADRTGNPVETNGGGGGTTSRVGGDGPSAGSSPVVPGAIASSAPVLVLLDMNGTLLYRAKRPLLVAAGDGAGTPAFVVGEPHPMHYYMRPGAKELISAMVRHPRVRLAFYTSMRLANALPAARFLVCGDGER